MRKIWRVILLAIISVFCVILSASCTKSVVGQNNNVMGSGAAIVPTAKGVIHSCKEGKYVVDEILLDRQDDNTILIDVYFTTDFEVDTQNFSMEFMDNSNYVKSSFRELIVYEPEIKEVGHYQFSIDGTNFDETIMHNFNIQGQYCLHKFVSK